MAGDLDENYELEEKFTYKQSHVDDSGLSSEEEEIETASNKVAKKRKLDQTKGNPFEKKGADDKRGESSTSVAKKKKKKNITEILQLKKDELSQPSYATNEFKKHVLKFMNDKLSSVEKNSVGLNEISLTGEEVETANEKLEKMIMKTGKLANQPFDEQFNTKFNQRIGSFLKTDASKSIKQAPYILILCSSAIRCIEVQKKLDATNEFIKSKKFRWTHAFAKHKKLNEQIDFLNKSKQPIHLVYATPARLAQLVEAEALKLDLLEFVVVDYWNRDVKQKRLFDMLEIREDFLKFCFNRLLKLNKDRQQLQFYLA